MAKKTLDIVFFGPPGVGKGTQAQRVSKAYHIPQVSTGMMMREEIRLSTPLGSKFDKYLKAGELVPDSLVFELVEARLRADAGSGAVFDGFPRTEKQAHILDTMLSSLGRELCGVIELTVPSTVLLTRLSGRRVCNACGETYHVESDPPPISGSCRRCFNKSIVQREDDKEEVVLKRFKEYTEKTEPVLNYYRGTNEVSSIDGSGSPSDVFHMINARIQAWEKK